MRDARQRDAQYGPGGVAASGGGCGTGQAEPVNRKHFFVALSQHTLPAETGAQVFEQSLSVAQVGAHVSTGAASLGGVEAAGFVAESTLPASAGAVATPSSGVSEPAQAKSSPPEAKIDTTATSAAGEMREVLEECEEEDFTVGMDYSRKWASTTFGPQISQ